MWSRYKITTGLLITEVKTEFETNCSLARTKEKYLTTPPTGKNDNLSHKRRVCTQSEDENRLTLGIFLRKSEMNIGRQLRLPDQAVGTLSAA